MDSSTQWSVAVAGVREQIMVQQPTQGELSALALVLLEEVWAAFKACDVAGGEQAGDVQAGSSTGSARTIFKRVLYAAHDMRLRAAPTFTSV